MRRGISTISWWSCFPAPRGAGLCPAPRADPFDPGHRAFRRRRRPGAGGGAEPAIQRRRAASAREPQQRAAELFFVWRDDNDNPLLPVIAAIARESGEGTTRGTIQELGSLAPVIGLHRHLDRELLLRLNSVKEPIMSKNDPAGDGRARSAAACCPSPSPISTAHHLRRGALSRQSRLDVRLRRRRPVRRRRHRRVLLADAGRSRARWSRPRSQETNGRDPGDRRLRLRHRHRGRAGQVGREAPAPTACCCCRPI